MLLVIKNNEQLFDSINKNFSKFQEENESLFMSDISNDTLSEVFDKHIQKTPIFRKRPIWDCSCCKHSIRQVARITAINENYYKLFFLEYFLKQYDLTANYSFLHDMFLEYIKLTRKASICNIFYSKESLIGAKKNIEPETGLVFNHFYFNVASKFTVKHETNDNFFGLKAVVSKYSPYTDVIKDIIFYIKEGYIYRGIEKLHILEDTLSLLEKYKEDFNLNLFTWKNIFNNAAFFNNDVISTLADDLIKEKNIEKALNSYNKKVAPKNYRQTTTTVITPTQIRECESDLEKLGYKDFTSGFSFAAPQDISILDVLWTNRKASKTSTLSNLLAENTRQSAIDSKASKIVFKEFLELLKTAKEIEINTSVLEKVVLLKSNFEQPVFAWNNQINFCYQTGLADVDIVSRQVKEKGGIINAKIRFSLYWENLDDLDLHLESCVSHIYYGTKKNIQTSFQLDIDMNVDNPVKGAVENIFAEKLSKKDTGQEFLVYVRNYTKREQPQNCLLNIYIDNKLTKQYSFKNPENGKSVRLFRFTINDPFSFNIIWSNKETEKLIRSEARFAKIDTVLLSPNYWEKDKGNKHIFFLKQGESIELRNIKPYNIEQLRPELVKHKKVLQLLANKIIISNKPQLVGFGISFSKKRELPIKINGRPYNLIVNPAEDMINIKNSVKLIKEACI